ncbi:recombination protein RecT [Lactobacillus plantarum subsp. plantarum ST-III] [Lactiplantibacillus plantarum]|uniref:Recombinase RecT n=2 Tax=Lactiplantibacillus TaxID=2767842 RepID=A0AAD0TPW5_9LACO|nr:MULTISPECIES: RecT family recombinase [Lactiplantibacillus]ALO04755.1 recombinase RecT [Lactiplantibacillus paraplantarum]ATI71917.1 recombinase RecT [Lactiplantibacillus plantarum]AYJ39244.1 recombinase RecT [Lactiplantibacillus paraplantarum]KGE74164.1 recombinase RecT [Lactiplantibacillus paraplantarum]KGH42077.1 Recombinational DNA repair protein RecT (prophage associated) [Lactiplantibacillus plantarum CMPG5300]
MSNELVTMVNNNIEDMKNNEGLSLPPDYSVGNALNSAYLILSDTSKGQPLLDKCDQGSVIKALMNMAIQGLSPAKNQCYFIPYGNQLVMQRSYFGSISVVKRLSNVKDIQAQVVHKDDTFKIGGENGVLVVKEFEPSFENLDKPIIGAFAWIEDINGNRTYTVMTKKDIDTSWSHAKTKKVQNEFPEEMAKRTVINRAAKFYINSSSDNDLFVQAVNETTSNEYENDDKKDVTPTKRSLVADVAENKAEKVESAEPAKEPVRTAAKEASSNDQEPVKDEVDQQNLFDNLGDLDAS